MNNQPASSRRCWKIPDGNYLVQTDTTPWPAGGIGPIRLPDGVVINHATAYSVFTAAGVAIASYPAPSAYSLEDILYLHDFYEVSVDDFAACCGSSNGEDTQELDERITEMDVEFSGLVECKVSELPFELSQHI